MRNILSNKKAQDLSVTTIIIIILAIVVLVFLVFGLMRGSGNLIDNIKNFFGGGSNIDTVKNACQTACATKSTYEYESVQREVKWDNTHKITTSCKSLESSILINAKCIVDGKPLADMTNDSCKDEVVWKADEGPLTTATLGICTVSGTAKANKITKANCMALVKFNDKALEATESAVLDSACTTL